MTEPTAIRRPYRGSCHCGATKYIMFLTFPHSPVRKGTNPVQRLYRCNCTTCHKAGIMHVRPASNHDDFLLLSPLDPFTSLGDYTCFDKKLHFFFCKSCGMRCFTFMGEGQVSEVDLEALGVKPKDGEKEGEDSKTKVWRAQEGGGRVYLSVNGYSLDAGQEGLDLREWTENKWLEYIDCLDLDGTGMKASQFDRPHEGGAY